MSEESNQLPKIPPISTTETFLLECSRSNSLIDKSQYKLQGGETNATWINATDNFRIKTGDQISIEMVALNLAQTTTPMEFTGQNVVLEGAETKNYVDNKVLLEIGYYINNNQSYSNNLPLRVEVGINDQIDPALPPVFPAFPITRQNIFPMADATAITEADNGTYPGYGMGFGHKYNNVIILGAGEGVDVFQYPNIDAASYLNSFRVVGFTDQDYITPFPMPLTSADNAYSVILERDFAGAVPPLPPATPSSLTSIKSFLHWEKIGGTANEGCFGSVGMGMYFELDDGSIENNSYPICDIRASTAGGALADVLRVQICFPKDSPGFAGSGGIGQFSANLSAGRACSFTTQEIRFNDIFRMQGQPSWNNTKTAPNALYGQNRQNSGITDFFTNGMQGFYTPSVAQPPDIVSPQPINLVYPLTNGNLSFSTQAGGGGIGSANRLQGTDNLPYIITRNDYMGSLPKANCENLGRYGNFTPNLRPLTSFIELEATDLLMDATALANKINEKLHQSLPGVGNNSDDINNYQTNVYGFTKRYRKSSQLLPYNNYQGYFPLHAFPQAANPAVIAGDGFVDGTYLNTQLWNTIDTYFSGGCKQIIPANFQPGFNKIDFAGYNANLYLSMDQYAINRDLGGSYPSFETTYLRTCKLPPDWYGDACSWNNVVDGNKGVKDLFKHMWGDAFNRLCVWDGNSRIPAGGTHQGATSRNFNMPVILNTQLQNYQAGNQLLYPDTYYDLASFDTTLLIKNQMIFTNIYYNRESMKKTEFVENNRRFPIGYDSFNKLRDNLIDKQREYEIYINTANKTANTYEKQKQDYNGWAIELDLGMTDDYETEKWVDGGADNFDSTPIKANWAQNGTQPPQSQVAPYQSWGGADWGLTPTSTSSWFGSGKLIPQFLLQLLMVMIFSIGMLIKV